MIDGFRLMSRGPTGCKWWGIVHLEFSTLAELADNVLLHNGLGRTATSAFEAQASQH